MSVAFAKAWTLICLSVVGLGLGFNAWLVASEARSVPPQSAARKSTGVVVLSLLGSVDVRGEDGDWRPLSIGAALQRGDEVRTGDFSQVVLRPNLGATLTVSPNTTFVLGEDSPHLARYTLDIGRVAAEIAPIRERRYEFDAASGDATADVLDGDFQIIADGEGLLGVTATRGEVGLSSAGQRVVVRKGERALAVAGAPPRPPEPIPSEVFLHVRWPDERAADGSVTVTGKTDVGARVRLADKRIIAGQDGLFEATVQLGGGDELVLLAEDARGNVKRSTSPPIPLAEPPPDPTPEQRPEPTPEEPVREKAGPPQPPLEIKVEGSLWD